MEQTNAVKGYVPEAPAPPIAGELDAAEAGLASLRESLLRLENRLGPVLQPEEGKASDPRMGVAAIGQPRSSVTIRISEVSASLCELTWLVNNIGGRLDC